MVVLGPFAAWFLGGWLVFIGFLIAVLVVDVVMDRFSYPKGNAPTPEGVFLFDQSFMLHKNAMRALEWMLDNTRNLGKTWSFKVRNNMRTTIQNGSYSTIYPDSIIWSQKGFPFSSARRFWHASVWFYPFLHPFFYLQCRRLRAREYIAPLTPRMSSIC